MTTDVVGSPAGTGASGADAAPLLVVDDVRTYFKSSRGLVRAVDGVSFELAGGRTLGIVGESGSGKTVLSRSIMGLLPKRNTQTPTGQVLFKGRDLRAAPRKELQRIWGRDVAVVFQDPMTSLNPVMKIGKQMTESMRRHLGISQDEADKRAVELLRSVDINEPDRRLEQYPHQLSGGMRQRVTIAMALGCGPELLIADEPTTALDVTVQAQILDLLQQQQRQRNMAMIIVTHDLGVVAGRTDEIIVMYAGQVVEKAPTRELFKSVRMPYTEALLQSIPRIEDNVDTRLKVIPGRPPDLAAEPQGCRFAPRCTYTQTKCLESAPPLVSEGDHQYRCWFPIGTELAVDPPARRATDGPDAAVVGSAADSLTTGVN